jgi:hypothetical protein
MVANVNTRAIGAIFVTSDDGDVERIQNVVMPRPPMKANTSDLQYFRMDFNLNHHVVHLC